MITNCRFALDEKRYVIDLLNPAISGKGYCHEGDPEDDSYLRERVLMVRLGEMLDKLIINLRPMQKLPSGEENKPPNEESFEIWWAMLGTIKASHLNTFDPALSVQHKFDGKLKRWKKHTQDFTSLALFRDDVECLLRDLYGDFEIKALDSVVLAVFRIVQQFAHYVRPDLWKEHQDAENLDYMLGIGVPEGGGISGGEWRRGMVAKHDLMLRVCEVRENPSAFSAYTGEFAARFGEMWDYSVEAAAKTIAAAMDPQAANIVTVDSQQVAATDIETRPRSWSPIVMDCGPRRSAISNGIRSRARSRPYARPQGQKRHAGAMRFVPYASSAVRARPRLTSPSRNAADR